MDIKGIQWQNANAMVVNQGNDNFLVCSFHMPKGTTIATSLALRFGKAALEAIAAALSDRLGNPVIFLCQSFISKCILLW